MSDTAGASAAVADAHRREWGRVLAATVRVTHDLDLAEDCVQDAYADALSAWRGGVPANPGAWLTTAARRRAIDVIRREANLRSKLPLIVEPDGDAPDAAVATDDRLQLIFLCCHPALAPQAQAALTLRLVCGVDTETIADLFLVSPATMAARLTRAKKKIATARIPFRLPGSAELAGRIPPVLATIYLLFTTAHTASRGTSLTRDDLADEALHLARTLCQLLPSEPEAQGLLALILASHARRASRTDDAGRLVRLENQDRALWDREAIGEADRLVRIALARGNPGPYVLQAAIAAAHATSPSYDATDWADILALYDELVRRWPTPTVALSRAVALAHVEGPAVALQQVVALEQAGELARYHYIAAVKAELLSELGRTDEAIAAYRDALATATNVTELDYLSGEIAARQQADGLAGPPPTRPPR